MIVQVGTDGGHIAHDLDTHVLQVLGRSKSGQQQKLRRAVGAAGNDHFDACRGGSAAFGSRVFDAGGPVVGEQHAGGMRAGADSQVGP